MQSMNLTRNTTQIGAAMTESRSTHVPASEVISIACYENEVPAFIEGELDRLYGSIFCSFKHFRVYGGAENAGVYIARKGKTIISVLLFRRQGMKVQVINEVIQIGRAHV